MVRRRSPGFEERLIIDQLILAHPPICCLCSQQPTTRVLHRPSRAAAGRSRSQPVRAGTTCLLEPCNSGWEPVVPVELYRSVTPEVAGSSPRRFRRVNGSCLTRGPPSLGAVWLAPEELERF